MHFHTDITKIHKLLEVSGFVCRVMIDLDHDTRPLIDIEFANTDDAISTRLTLDSEKSIKLAHFLAQIAQSAERGYTGYWEQQNTPRNEK